MMLTTPQWYIDAKQEGADQAALQQMVKDFLQRSIDEGKVEMPQRATMEDWASATCVFWDLGAESVKYQRQEVV